ncbi:LPXTG-motif cell wall anchor domain protein [Streptococcus vestibularis F0396]|uniref:LPXTG-motif cell wall anchor domain protein n=4 Tax=Streptococcus vestibularis TaxID=1343 RepID=E3CTG1_STRVE|nr:LPXTG-motif cell wall anchor domain protein [Streptococcus vestibularis F0396]
MKGKQQQDFRVEKYIRYGIRKYSFGAASVAIAAGLMFLGNGAVSASETSVNGNTADSSVVASNPENDGTSTKAETPVTEKEVKAEEPKKEDTSVQKEAEEKTPTEAPKANTEKTAEKVAANKTALYEAISSLENRIAVAKNADASALSAAKEALATAKSVFANPTDGQSEVDSQTEALKALATVLVESNAAETAKKEEAANQNQDNPTVDTKVLNQTLSEAEVTNQLAYSEMNKKDLSDESKGAIEAAIAKNKVVLAETTKLLADKSLTQEQVDAQLNRLNESIQAVYDELKRNGIGQDGKFAVALSANEGYTASSTELRKENGEFLGSTGKSYKVLDGNDNYKIYVHGYQSENTDVPAANSGQAGISGRTDIPLSKTEAQKLGREAALWKGKIRATGKANGNTTWGSGGAYEYIATEIYGYTYEQGNHYVYLTDVKKRFSLSDEATAAGYKITNVALSNLIPGLAYNEATDTVEGYVASSLQNGVYDMRYIVTVEKDGATQQVTFRDLTAGWIGWQDTSAPLIQGSSKLVTVGDEVSHNIKYVDNDGMSRDERTGYVYRSNGEKVVAGSKTAPGSTSGATFTAVDGSKVNTENGPQTVTAHTSLNGNYTGSQTSINDVVPGLNYNPQTGDITGTASEAGIFTAAVYAKDYNNTTNAKNQDWNMYGQEAHENITIAVAPKITVKNVEAYATNIPVTISNGANKAEITMPDGTVTKLVAKNGNWVVAAGTTNTAVQEGAVLAPVATSGESTINLTVTPKSTKYVGVDNIAAKATTDKVKANIQREFAMVTDAAGNTYKAVFNHATGKYSLPTEKAYELKDNGNGTSTLIERRVYTDAQANGDVKFVVYEFERTWNTTSSASTLEDKIAEIRKNGEVTAVGNVTRTETLIKKDNTSSEQGMVVTVSYDSVTNQWTSSDGTAVTAKESNAGWEIETASGFKGYVSYREASSTDVASIQNAKPTGTSTSYSEAKGTSVDLIKSTKANVAFADTIDDKTSATDSDTIKTKVTATAPDGSVTTFDGAQAEETAYIQAQRTAAAKTQAAATAVKEQQDTQNELARLQELLDRQTRVVEDAQKALDDLKLRTISPTAQELAERKLANSKEFKASIEEQLATAKANLTTKTTEVETARTAALEAEKAVETARTALKTAAESNLAKANAYVLSQKGRYKVTARAVDSNGVVTTPTVDGTDAGEVTEDAVAETTYYIVVTEPEKSSGAQAQKQTDSMADNFNDGKEGTTVSNYKLVDPKTGAKVESLTTEEGTYTVDPTTGEVSFTPAEGFVGTAAPITVAADVTFNDESGNPVTVPVSNTYTPTVYGIDPADDETTGKQGQTQTSISGKERFEELNTATNTPDGTNVDWTTAAYSLEGANAEGKVVVDGEGTYSIDPTTGVVTFEPLPTFTGKAKGVNVQVSVTATDSEGNKVPVTSKGSYTPEVTPVKPTGEGVTSSGKQGQEQTGTPKFTQGDETAPITINEQQPAKFVVNGQPVEDKEIPATKDGKEVGKYVIDPLTGVVTFKPNKDFVGTPDPATVEVKDKNGTPATATYTPTVTPVTPTAEPKETTGKQGQPQTQDTESMFKQGDEVAPIDKTTVKLVDPSGNEVTTMPALKDGKEVGTYTIDPTTGVITFQPNKDFVGTPDPAKVVAKDTNGTKVETTYTPTVTPVTPTAEPKETTGKQGQPQTQDTESMFKQGDEVAPIDKTTVKLVDPSGNEVTTMPALKDGKEVGTYTIDPTTGVITFQPNKDFVGTPDPAKVVAKDTNGTKVETTYTPTVTPVTPTAEPAETTDIQGKTQNGTPTFTPGNPEVPMDDEVPATFEDGSTTKTIPGEGTYTVAKDGTVIFTPEKTFTGVGTGVTVKRVDKNGTPVTAKYTPTVTPVKPEGTPAVSEGPKGQPQTGTPTFTPGNPNVPIDEDVPPTFEDGTTTKIVPGEGTYTIDENGKVTFTPEPDFVGKASGVTVKRVDKNGTPVTATYTPTVRPDTSFVDKDGNPLSLTEDGTKPTKDIPGYKIVKTEVDEKGNTKHIYEKVTTTHKDKDGNVIPGTTTEEGTTPKKDIPGYRFVETKTLPNGDTEHVYEKVKTSHKDKDGNEIPNYPTEDGEQPKKDIPGYRFVETKTLPNGDIEHVYEKVKTSHKDKDGNEIPNYPTEDGEQPKKDIPGYRFVETKKLPNGDIEHVYEKVSTPAPTPSPVPQPTPGKQNTTTWTDENGNPLKPTESGSKEPGTVSGYEYVKTVTDPNGNIKHIFKKVEMPTPRPVEPSQPATPKYVEGQKELPNTGTEDNNSLVALGLLGVLSGFGLVARKKKED